MTEEAETTKDEEFWESYRKHLAWLKTSREPDDDFWKRYEGRLMPMIIETKYDGLIGIYRRISTVEWTVDKLFQNREDPEGTNWKRTSTFDIGVAPIFFDFERMGPKNTAVIGAIGNGKTVVAYDIAEEALMQNYPVLVLDPTGQWTGFLEECKSKRLLDNYPLFGIAGPVDFRGRIYTPNSNAGLSLEINLLAKPATDDLGELRAHAKEVSELIKDFCNLTGAEPESVKNVIYNAWKNGKSLDHSSILNEFKDDKIKGKLEDLIAAKIVFEGKGIDDISSLWKAGEITTISLDKIRRKKNENLAMYYFLSKIVDYFDLLPDATEGKSLRLLLVIEEAHRFSDKLVHEVLDRITRTLRKKGLGVLFVTQRFVDLGEMQTNVNTKIYMRTMHLADIERASVDIGALANKLPSLKTGVGIIFSPEVDYIEERYEPIIEFRPCLHRNTGLTEEEIKAKMC